MNPDQERFLKLELLPARFNAEQAGWYLGLQSHQVPILVAADLLRPLGHPAPNSPKYFLMTELEQIRADRKVLSKATDAIQSYWRNKRNRVPGAQTSERRGKIA